MIELKNICKEYVSRKKKMRALHNVNLTLGENGLVCLVGESGCGKTTLLNLLGTLDSPSYGDILIDGKSIIKMRESEINAYRATQIGFIFQDLNLIEDLTVRDNLLLVCNKDELESKHRATLQKLKIDEFADKLPKELSGGQRQRVAIARAIVKGSRVLLCDEPTGSLDPDNAVIIFETLKEISHERLVVVVSHDIATASKYADRMIRLHNGEVQSDTASEQEYSKEQENAPYAQTAEVSSRPKAKQRLRGLFGLSVRYLKCKPARLTIMAVISVLIFTLLSIVSAVSSYDRNSMIRRAMDKNDVRYFTVEQTFNGRIVALGENALGGEIGQKVHYPMHPWSREDIGWFSEIAQCTVDPIYNQYVWQLDNLGEKEKDYTVTYLYDNMQNAGVVHYTSDFAARYGFTLYGSAPEKEFDIVLGGHAFNLFKTFGYHNGEQTIDIREPADLIGRTIKVKDYESIFTVTGILDTRFNAERYDPTRKFKDSERLKLRTYTKEFNAIEKGSVHNVFYVSDAYYTDILLNGAFLGAPVYRVLVPTLNKKITSQLISFDNDRLLRDGTYLDFNNECAYESVQFGFNNEVVAAVERADAVFSALAKYMRYVFIGVAVIAVLVVYLYFSALLNSREKDVGVLRTNGYTKGEMVLPFIFEALILSAGFIVLSVIVSAIAIPVFVKLFNAQYSLLFTPISFTFAQVGLIVGVQLLFAAVGILLPLLLLLRKKPMQIINAGK